jgi:D-alanyl-D-alanine carboxypeptidase/D-alanyl-D-alanine-endopeptidase (penicillin-binding protein 4)
MLVRVLLLCALSALVPSLSAQGLPPDVLAALTRAKVPVDAVSVWVGEAQPSAPGQHKPRVAHRVDVPMNPASVMKLVTTYAALDLLGPAYVWRTPVYVEGTVRDGTLHGNLYIKGQGDPKLVLERLWLLLRRVQGLGIRTIAGDIVLDRSAFATPDSDPAQFDGEPLRPYNAAPDALLINYKAVVMTFTPDRTANVAQVQFDPPLAGVSLQGTVPLSNMDCGDYRASLRADFSEPSKIRFLGSYPLGCGEKVWPVAYADPKTYAARAVQGMWQDAGGKLTGSVRTGTVPASIGSAAKPAFEVTSAPLAEVIRDINKYSNNVMAQQVFLTLGAGNFENARAVVQRWWQDRLGATDDAPVLENGSGLSRDARISAQGLAHMLRVAYRSPLMPELMASLPISGVDGTLKRVQSSASGSAHLKTGSLSNVVAVAGYVHATSGKRYVLVAMVNHSNATAAGPAIQTLVEWATRDQ